MTWHELAENPQAASQLYDVVPPLERFELMEVRLDREGRLMSLRGDLNWFPDHPPARWVRSGFNTAQLQLDCFFLERVQIEGWAQKISADIKIDTTHDRKISLRLDSSQCTIFAVFQFFRIAKITGYLNGGVETSG